MSLISIIIPNWNGERFLADCLNSLLLQSCNNFEVIIIDNGSTDSSLQIIDNYNFCRLIRFEKNQGFAKAVNAGISASTADIIALVNNDVILNYDWIEKASAAMEIYSDYDFAATKVLCMHDPSAIDSAGFEVYAAGAVYSYNDQKSASDLVSNNREVFGAVASAALYRKKLFDKIGYFDEDFFAYFEDTDISFRARLAGYKCIYLSDVICMHVGSGTGGENSPFFVFYGRRNIEYLFFLNMFGYLFWKYLLAHLLYEVIVFIAYLRMGLSGCWFKAKSAAFKQAVSIINKRSIRKELVSAPMSDIDKLFIKGLFKNKLSRYRYCIRRHK